MRKSLLVGASLVAVFALVAVAQAQQRNIEDVGGNIFDMVSVDLKVNGQNGPVSVAPGSRIVVSWTSDGGAFRCRGNWSRNDIPTSGTISGRISKSVLIRAACIDREGNRDDDFVAVNVAGSSVINQPTVAPVPTSGNTGTGNTGVSTPAIKVLNPNGGEKLTIGQPYTLRWSTANVPANTTVLLQLSYKTSFGLTYEEVIASGLVNSGSYQWTVPEKYATGYQPGSFMLRAILSGPNIVNPGGPQDYSDNYFTITSQAAAPGRPTLSSVTPTTGPAGTYVTLYGSNFSASGNTVYLRGSTGTHTLAPVSQGSTYIRFYIPSWATGTYTISIERDDLLIESNSKQFTVTPQEKATPPPPPGTTPTTQPRLHGATATPGITVDLKANSSDGPLTVAAGTTVVLSYTTTGKIAECKGDVSGSETGAIRVIVNASKTYTVTCSIDAISKAQDGGSGIATDSVRVEVSQPAETTTTSRPSITVTGPVNSYLTPNVTNVTFTSSNISRVKIEACVNKTDCTTLANEVSITNPGSGTVSTSWRWEIAGSEPFVGPFGTKQIYIKVTDLASGVFDLADSYIYISSPTSAAASNGIASESASNVSKNQFASPFISGFQDLFLRLFGNR